MCREQRKKKSLKYLIFVVIEIGGEKQKKANIASGY